MEPGFDPSQPVARNEHGEEVSASTLNENQISLWESIKSLFAIPTFVLLFLRSSFDGIPSNANSLFILWYEYLGFTESEASLIVTVMYSSAAVSSLAGGIMADSIMKRARVKLDAADRVVDQKRASPPPLLPCVEECLTCRPLAHTAAPAVHPACAGHALMEARQAHAAAISNGANAESESEQVEDARDDFYDAQVARTDAMNSMNNSRIIFAQLGAALALIFCIMHFKVGPKTRYMGGDTPLEDALWWFLPIGLLMNLVGNWDEQACDLPLMSYVSGRNAHALARAPRCTIPRPVSPTARIIMTARAREGARGGRGGQGGAAVRWRQVARRCIASLLPGPTLHLPLSTRHCSPRLPAR